MPHMNFKNISIEEVKVLSKDYNQILSDAFVCPNTDITYDVMSCVSIINGEIISGDKTIIIQMFDRPKEVRDKVMKILTAFFKEVTIIFEIIDVSMYYENGVQF